MVKNLVTWYLSLDVFDVFIEDIAINIAKSKIDK